MPLSSPGGRCIKVLVADDDPQVRRFCEMCLAMSQLEPLGAPDGEQALMVAAENSGAIDLLVTDISMPKLSGIQLGIVFRVLWPQVKVLYMSGTPPPEALLEPDCVFLPKPFTAQQFREAVQAATGIRFLGVRAPAA